MNKLTDEMLSLQLVLLSFMSHLVHILNDLRLNAKSLHLAGDGPSFAKQLCHADLK